MLLGYKVSRSHSKRRKELCAPSCLLISLSRTPSPFLHPTAVKGFGTGMKDKGADLAAGTEASPILHQSPQGKIQRDSDSGPGISPPRAVLRMEKSKNFTRTLTVRSFFVKCF